MKLNSTLFLLTLFLVFNACNKEDDSPKDDTTNGRHSGVFLYDSDGNFIDCHGGCDDDWTNLMLAPEDIPHFSFPDQIMVNGTSASTVSDVVAYPNPIPQKGNMTFSATLDGASYFRMIIIDSWGQPSTAYATPVASGKTNFLLQWPLFERLRTGDQHRMYFAFYNADEEIIFSSRGDFVVCEKEIIEDVFSCIE